MEKIIKLIILTLFLTACGSKNVEIKPIQVSPVGISIAEKLKIKNQLEEKLTLLNKQLSEIQNLANSIRYISESKEKISEYGVIDFLLDMNKQFKSYPVEVNTPNEYLQVGEIIVDFQGLSDECKKIETRLLIKTDQVNAESKIKISNDYWEYQIKTCGTNREFKPLAKLSWSGLEAINKSISMST